MNVIIGNGVNYEQFPEKKWSSFTTFFDKRFQENYAKIKQESGTIHKFLSKIIINILQEETLEKKLIFSDYMQVAKSVSKEDWLWLIVETQYFEVDWLEYVWNLANGIIEPDIALISGRKFQIRSSTLSMVFFTSVQMLFNTSILDVLEKDFQVKKLDYSSDFIKWLKTFENVFTFNVDGIMNKTNINTVYPHGFLNFYSPEAYYLTYIDKVKEQDPELLAEITEMCKHLKVNPYEVLFNFSSEEKIKEVEFYNSMLNNGERSWNMNDASYEKSKETVNENREFMNIDERAYEKLSKLNGDVIIIGLSYRGDQECFNILGKNNSVRKIYFYGEKSEFALINNKKFIYCGFWSKKEYLFK